MMTHEKITVRKGSSLTAVVNYFLSEYYINGEGKEISVSKWDGDGAKALGLTGPVSKEALAAVLAGFSLEGKKLVKNAGDEKRRLTDDLTFSADKSISLLWVSAPPSEQEKIHNAGDETCSEVIEWMKGQLETYRRDGEKRPVSGLVIARFQHHSNRNGEPQLHWHNAVMNLALDHEGQWGAMDNKKFLELQHTAGALFRAGYAKKLRALGYVTEKHRERDADARETGEVWHQIKNIDAPTCRAFSSRRVEIEEAMEERGLSAQAACLATRKDKEELSYSETMSRAIIALDDMRTAGKITWKNTDELKGVQGRDELVSDADILRRLHMHDAFWSRDELLRQIAKENGGRLGVRECVAETERFLIRAQVVKLSNDEQGKERWCSQSQLDTEQGIGQAALARKDEQEIRVDAQIVADAIAAHEKEQGWKFSEEQSKAVRFVTMETGGLACVSGEAGAGKTATSGGYIKAFQAAGFRVIGTATAWDAAEKLKAETGLETYSIASLLTRLEQGLEKPDKKTVYVVDEAGMVGADRIRDLQRWTDRVGAKLILVGDVCQLQPVEASAGFALAIRATGEAKLSEIRRQKSQEDKDIARLFYAQTSGEKIVAAMEKRGQVHLFEKSDDAKNSLVDDYIKTEKPAIEKIIIAPTNAQVQNITRALREELKAKGEITGVEAVEVRGKLFGERAKLELGVGDRLRFGKRDAKLQVTNGSVGVVEFVAENSEGGHTLRVRIESEIKTQHGRVIEVQTNKFDALSHGWAGTVHKSQGQGKESVFWFAEGKSVDRNLGLVAFTRQKETLGVYTTERGKEQLCEALDTWRMKQNAVDFQTKITPSQTRTESMLEKIRTQADSLVQHFKEVKSAALEQVQGFAKRRSRSHTIGG